MIISGIQTGNTRWLAAHLQNTADNEDISISQITGTVAQDIDGALAEFDAYTAGTRAKEGVYAAFINPPRPLSAEEFNRALEVIEKRLGLSGQPRIVLFHVKNGRKHCHAVWSRIDLEQMKAIHLSHDKQKLRRCAQELAAEFGTELPPGLQEDRGADRFDERKAIDQTEKAMAEISGLSVEERRDAITNCYYQSDSAEAFVHALEAAGFILARGDRRAFVVVDIAGDVHSLARQIDGAKTRDIKKKLEGLGLSLLPPVARAKVLMAQRAQAQADAARAKAKRIDLAKKAAENLKAVQDKRRAALDLLWQKMKIRHMHERKVLLAHIIADKEIRLKRHWTQIGLAKHLRKIAVIRQLLEHYAEKKRRSLEDYYQQLKASLQRRHENEERELRRRNEALMRLERREEASFAVMYGLPTTATSQSGVSISYSFARQPFEYQAPIVAAGDWSSDLNVRQEPDVDRYLAHHYRKMDEPLTVSGWDGSGVTATFNVNANRPDENTARETEEENAGAAAHGTSQPAAPPVSRSGI